MSKIAKHTVRQVTKTQYVVLGFVALAALFPFVTSADGAELDFFQQASLQFVGDTAMAAEPMMQLMQGMLPAADMDISGMTGCPFADIFPGIHELCEQFSSDIAHD